MLEIINIPEQKIYENKVFPLTFSTNNNPNNNNLNDIIEWLESNRDYIDKLLREHKAILFRNHELVKTHHDFHRFIEALNYKCMEYLGGAAVRTQLTRLYHIKIMKFNVLLEYLYISYSLIDAINIQMYHSSIIYII